jgi:phasin
MSNGNPKSASSTKQNVPQQLHEITEKNAEQSREFLGTISSATSEAASAMQNCCSTALKGMQDYNSKVIEFAHENTKSYADFMQKLVGVKSPTDFIQVSRDHTQRQLETLTKQAKELAALVQQTTEATVEPLKASVAKSHDHAAS